VTPLGWVGLAATTAVAAALQAAGGFGFAVLAAPLFLMFVDPGEAVQLVIILTAALSIVVLPGLRRSVDRWRLLRLAIGCLAGLPIGIAAFAHTDPIAVRATIGVTILVFAALLVRSRRRAAYEPAGTFGTSPGRDLAAGAVSGAATALVGMSGPPVLIYLLLAGVPPRPLRATLLAFFALSYMASLTAHAVTIGVPARTWLAAAVLAPFAFLGGLAGRPLGDRLGAEAFNTLAIGLLTATGVYTLAAATMLAAGR
jgi:uncharacterized protein